MIDNLRGQIRAADQEKDAILREKEDMTGSKSEVNFALYVNRRSKKILLV